MWKMLSFTLIVDRGQYLFSYLRESSYCDCCEVLQIQLLPYLCVNDTTTMAWVVLLTMIQYKLISLWYTPSVFLNFLFLNLLEISRRKGKKGLLPCCCCWLRFTVYIWFVFFVSLFFNLDAVLAHHCFAFFLLFFQKISSADDEHGWQQWTK